MKIFVVSDIHGYYDILRKSLSEKGFEENNPEHLLICCGDYFDRGTQPFEVMTYLMSLTNVILIRGNHEDLMEDMLYRGYAESHDLLNGTKKTVYQLSEHVETTKRKSVCTLVHDLIQPFYDKMLNYYETKNYIFVHGWIPLGLEYIEDEESVFYRHSFTSRMKYNKDWRNASDFEWHECRWCNGMEKAKEGFIEPNKTIVCGHWHCMWGNAKRYKKLPPEEFQEKIKDSAIWEPYKDKGIIAIDRSTARTNEMNVLVIEDNLL